jgi:hypothetical protein
MRVPVISAENTPLMPTKASRARRWIKAGIAIGKFNKLGIFYVQLTIEKRLGNIKPTQISRIAQRKV